MEVGTSERVERDERREEREGGQIAHRRGLYRLTIMQNNEKKRASAAAGRARWRRVRKGGGKRKLYISNGKRRQTARSAQEETGK